MKFKLHPKTPLPMVLGLVVNLILIIAVEALGIYRLPARMEQEDFSRISSKYEGCTILTKSETGQVSFYLVETADGQTDLIPVQRHAFFPSRGRAVKGKITGAEELTQGASLRMVFGLQIYNVSLRNQIIQVAYTGGLSGTQSTLSKYLLLAAVLTFAEIALWQKLRDE